MVGTQDDTDVSELPAAFAVAFELLNGMAAADEAQIGDIPDPRMFN